MSQTTEAVDHEHGETLQSLRDRCKHLENMLNFMQRVLDDRNATITDLQGQLEAVGAGGVGPLMARGKVEQQAEPLAWIDAVMAQAQVFASAWSLVGGRFDYGSAIDDAEQAKEALRAMLYNHPQPAQQPEWPNLDRPARVGGGLFGVGVTARYVVAAAQRAHEEHLRVATLTHEQMMEEERSRRNLWDLVHGPIEADQQAEPVAWIEMLNGAVTCSINERAARKLPDRVKFDLYPHAHNGEQL